MWWVILTSQLRRDIDYAVLSLVAGVTTTALLASLILGNRRRVVPHA